MVADVRAAVDFALCRSSLRGNSTLCSPGGKPDPPPSISRIPYVDINSIYVAGFSLGGTVALHAAALDDRIAGLATFAGFTPFRTDSLDRPTGGLARLFDLHALLPRMGYFRDNPAQVPYDYDELISSIAPRPILLYTPQSDRDATYEDVKVQQTWLVFCSLP